MKLTQFVEALSKRGIGEALLRGGEPMQTRVEGEWRGQGAAIPAATLGAMIDQGAPAEALSQWQSENRCQFEHDGFLIKAARQNDKIQVAVKRATVSTSPFADATNGVSTTVIAPTAAPATSAPAAAKAPQQPAGVEWFYLDEGAEKGPLAPDRLRVLVGMGTIGGDTLVWSDGMSDWKPARDSDLRAMLPAAALNPTPAAPPLSPAAPIAAPTGDAPRGTPRVGGGRLHEIPPSNDKFSIGAFALPLFWCSSHNQISRFWPILLTGFIPCVGGLVSLYLTIQLASEANSLAWVSREWDSVEHFEKTQRVWTIVGSIMLVLSIGFVILSVLLGGD